MAKPAYACRVRSLIAGIVVMWGLAAGASREQFIPVYDTVPGGPPVPATYESGGSPYTGIGRYEGRTDCTAFFLATALPRQEYLNDAPAYAVTSGRCAALPGPNEVLIDRPGVGRVIFNYFSDSRERSVAVAVARVAYATMKGRDLAILELAIPYTELIRQLVRPWRVPHSSHVGPGDVIAIVSAPRAVDPADDFLRLVTCRMEGIAPIVLEHTWHSFDATLNRCRGVGPGSSGAPVLSVIDRYAIGTVSTTTVDAGPLTTCALGHPCEPVNGGARSRHNTNYVTQLAGITSCFDDRHRFSVDMPECPLDAGSQLDATPPTIGPVNPRILTQPLGPIRRTWNVTVSGSYPFYRYAIVSPDSADCRTTNAYSSVLSVTAEPLIDAPLRITEGFELLCIWGTRTSEDVPGAAEDRTHPTVIVTRIDRTPPRLPAHVTIDESGTAWRVLFGGVGDEVAFHVYKIGHPREIRCDDPSGYRLADVPSIGLPRPNGPYRLCAIPYDAAQNPGPVFERVLQ